MVPRQREWGIKGEHAMRYRTMSASLNQAKGIITIRDYSFAINLTSAEALVLLHWLQTRTVELQTVAPVQPGNVPAAQSGSIELASFLTTFAAELWRRVGDLDVADLETSGLPDHINPER